MSVVEENGCVEVAVWDVNNQGYYDENGIYRLSWVFIDRYVSQDRINQLMEQYIN